MARGKGINGETCEELIEDAIKQLGSPCGAGTLFQEVKRKWRGSDDTIWQHLMSRVVNLPPAYFHWQNIKDKNRFLLLREDGRYELYNPSKHGTYRNGTK
jgi:uncharacterized phage-like protein YoqJ